MTSILDTPGKIYFWSKGPEEFRFLSNFYVASVTWGEHTFKSSEHLFQSRKAKNLNDLRSVMAAPYPAAAKMIGDKIEARDDWDVVRDQYMIEATLAKFQQNPDLAEKLLLTDGFELVHYAPWGDTYWGVDKDGNGQNKQGKILMFVREQLKQLKEERNA